MNAAATPSPRMPGLRMLGQRVLGQRVLVIGYGNSLRRDDGVGLLLAPALAATWQAAGHAVSLITSHQLEPEHAADIAATACDIVLFVDAADRCGLLGGPAPYALTPVAPAAASATLGHHLGPALALYYAAELYTSRPAGWLLQLPGHDFTHGEGLSPATQTALDATLAAAPALWQTLCAAAPGL